MRIVTLLPLFIAVFILSLPKPCEAITNRSIIFGGGCDIATPEQLRDSPYKTLLDVQSGLAKRGWNVNFEVGAVATKAGLLKVLDDEIAFARHSPSTPIQLYVHILTHGTPESKNSPHLLYVMGPDGNCTGLPVDDSDFTARLLILKNLGVKLAFTDASCYSGGSLKTLSPFGCVVTSQSSDRGAVGNPMEAALSAKLTRPSPFSMEDFWAASLVGDTQINQPMISGFKQGVDQGDLATLVFTEPFYFTFDGKDMAAPGPDYSCNREQYVLGELDPLLKEIITGLEEGGFRNRLVEITGNPSEPALNALTNLLKQQFQEYRQLFAPYAKARQDMLRLEAELKGLSLNVDFSGMFAGKSADQIKWTQNVLLQNFGVNLPVGNQGISKFSGLDLYRIISQLGNLKQSPQPLLLITQPESQALLGTLSGAIAALPPQALANVQKLGKARDQAEQLAFKSADALNKPLESDPSKGSLTDNIYRNINKLRYYRYQQEISKTPNPACRDFQF